MARPTTLEPGFGWIRRLGFRNRACGSQGSRLWLEGPGLKRLKRRVFWFDEYLLENFVRRIRERWKDSEIIRVEQHRSKQVIYVRMQGVTVKLIVYRDGRIRAYGGAGRVSLALKRVAERVLGVDKRDGR
jgi:hypothetical protein